MCLISTRPNSMHPFCSEKLYYSRTQTKFVRYWCTFGALLINQNCEIILNWWRIRNIFHHEQKHRTTLSNTELKSRMRSLFRQKPTITAMKMLIIALYYAGILPWKSNLRIQHPLGDDGLTHTRLGKITFFILGALSSRNLNYTSHKTSRYGPYPNQSIMLTCAKRKPLYSN